jgi:putative hydrolase of the HAD superfamily
VLLDAFGTLLTLENPVSTLRELLAERLGVELTDAQAADALAVEVAFYRAHMHLGRDEASLAELHLRCGEVLRAQLPGYGPAEPADPADPARAHPVAVSAEAVTEVLLEALRFRVYPEVPATLVRLRDADVALVVVSNWDASLEQVLARAGLRAVLDGVISSAVVGAAKPDPLPLRRGLELAGVAAHEAVHVGDSQTEDVDGALAAGIRPVLLTRGGERGERGGERGDRHSECGDSDLATITSLAELPTLLGL